MKEATRVVRAGLPETAQGQYDCRPFLSSNNEACDFDNPQAGTWHIGFHGYAAYTGVTLEGSWTPAQTTGGDTLQETVTGESGSWTFFKIEVPEGALSLTVELFEGTGDADLYAFVALHEVHELRLILSLFERKSVRCHRDRLRATRCPLSVQRNTISLAGKRKVSRMHSSTYATRRFRL